MKKVKGLIIAALSAVLVLSVSSCVHFSDLNDLEVADYGIADTPWAEKYGNHRAVVDVADADSAVFVRIPWRLKNSPAGKRIIVVEASTGQEISLIRRSGINRFSGDITFKSNQAGQYFVYYMPYTPDPGWAGFKGGYLLPNVSNYFPSAKEIKSGELVKIESRTAHDSFFPMEVCATNREMSQLLAKEKGKDYLVFPEDRLYQVRMKKYLPARWIKDGERLSFSGTASRNEYYPFQIALYPLKRNLKNVTFAYSGLKGPGGASIEPSRFTCFNIEGFDYTGKYFTKIVDVAKHNIQPFWIGIDIPSDAVAGVYSGYVDILIDGEVDRRVDLEITIDSQLLEDRGDSDLWRMARLRWLNSTAGLDDDVMIAPFSKIEYRADGDNIVFGILNRHITIGANGLPLSIMVGGREILSEPVAFKLDGSEKFTFSKAEITSSKAYSVTWKTSYSSSLASYSLTGKLEADGHLDFSIEVVTGKSCLERPSLSYSLTTEASEYLFGLSGGAQRTPAFARFKWSGPRDSFWIGSAWAGIHCELKGAEYTGPLLNLYKPAYPKLWHNNSLGSISVKKSEDSSVVTVTSGLKLLNKDEKKNYEFAFIITPVKDLDWNDHFSNRYYHATPQNEQVVFNNFDPETYFPYMPLDDHLKTGINVLNIHHAQKANPYINYPFATPEKIKETVKEAHSKGLKIKYYYTVRELTNAVYEIWALRSLGDEIFKYGNGGGAPWLREHLEDDYIPAWYSHNGEDLMPDAALTTSGITRWYNYYVEGLRWMVKNYDIDGVYMDDVAFDRTILKRMRRLMQETKPGCMIDLHSNTGFSKGPALQYLEFFPYLDRLWFGESFQYNSFTPAEFLVEASGIPFGVGSNMLNAGGNLWRGLLFGMTSRYPWFTENHISDPRPAWKLLDYIGTKDFSFIPYWDENSFVSTGDDSILASTYISGDKKRIMICFANWGNSVKKVSPEFDFSKLGLNTEDYEISFAEVDGFQKAGEFSGSLSIRPVEGAILFAVKK
ncbi:MAG: hypothetical protein JXR63_09075 [Spirochaetales bacterium]|nr:hypothetical protein [Spirochaetales bacterium]